MKMISKNIIIIISILILSTIVYSNYCYASTSDEFTSFNNAPRKSFSVSSDKLADVTITIKDNNGISSVKLYSADSEGKKGKEINFSSSNTKDSKQHIYTLSHKNLLKGKTKSFYIQIKDTSGNIQYSGFRVCVKTKTVKNKKVKYYSIDDSPRVQDWRVSGSKVSFIVKDLGGTKYAKVQDANNANKEIDKFESLAKGEAKVTIDMSKFKTSDGIYKLRIVTEDNNKQQAIRKVYFKMNVVKTTTTSKDKNVSSFMASLEKISQQVQKDYKAGKKWKYTNGVNSENKLPFKYTFEEALKTNTRTTNCADYVMWALHECGIFSANQKFYGNNSGGITYKKNSETKVEKTLKENATIIKVGNKTAAQLVKAGKLKKGDICLYKGHTNVYAGNNKWYDAGRRFDVNGYGTRTNYTFTTLGPIKGGTSSKTVTYIIRLKDQS